MKYLWIILIIILIIFYKKSSFEGNQSVYSLYNDRFKTRFKLNEIQGYIDGVDMVYVISMPQRFEYIVSQIDSLGVNCKFLDAITPNDLSDEEYSSMSTINEPGSNIYNKRTRLPVLLSFIMCFIDAIVNGYDTIIIFEDDIVIDIDLKTLNATTLEFKQSDADILYLGYCFLNCYQQTFDSGYLKILSDPSILCGHALCLKTKKLPSLIDYCFPMKRPSDELFIEWYKNNNIKVCIPKKPYFNQVDRKDQNSLNESTNILKYCR